MPRIADTVTRDKWDKVAKSFDFLGYADDHRYGPYKRELFKKILGKTLMVAAGTGNDFKFFPPGLDVVALDISPKMLAKAAVKAARYDGKIELREADVCHLDYADASFDTVVTVCTFCSVPKPIVGLQELRRVLKPGGQILMFEHVRSAIGAFGIVLDMMTPLTRKLGPEMNRDTVGNVQKAGFRLRRVSNVYLDIVKTIEGVKESA
jgi:ubiquinone/menaquinone biosynthesis C-methylase UbiE